MSSNRRAFQAQLGFQTLQTPQNPPPDPSQEVLDKILIFSIFFYPADVALQLARRPPLPLRGSGGRRAMLKRRLNRYTKRPLREEQFLL